jgi:hypothetical protein
LAIQKRESELPRKMKTLITIAALIALIGNVSMANAQTNGTSKNASIYVAAPQQNGRYSITSSAVASRLSLAPVTTSMPSDACDSHNHHEHYSDRHGGHDASV